jgi:lysophospholipase L1-like esterase
MKSLLPTVLLATLCTQVSHCFQTTTRRTPFLRHCHRQTSTSDTSGEMTSTKIHRILCYGDSLTAGTSSLPWELYPYAPHLEQALNNAKSSTSSSTFVVRHRGMPGWTADAMVDAANDPQNGLRSAIRGIQNPALSCVIILAGTNDLGYAFGLPKEQRVSAIVTPVQALHEMAWANGVEYTIAIAVPPSGYQAQVREAADLARAVNQSLQEFCQQSGGKAHFVHFPFEYQMGGENWCSDGLHFSPKGYQVLGEYLAEPVMKLLEAK